VFAAISTQLSNKKTTSQLYDKAGLSSTSATFQGTPLLATTLLTCQGFTAASRSPNYTRALDHILNPEFSALAKKLFLE